jgi:hypothetical protein
MLIFEIDFSDGSSEAIPIASDKDWSVDSESGYLIIERVDGARIIAPLVNIIVAKVTRDGKK